MKLKIFTMALTSIIAVPALGQRVHETEISSWVSIKLKGQESDLKILEPFYYTLISNKEKRERFSTPDSKKFKGYILECMTTSGRVIRAEGYRILEEAIAVDQPVETTWSHTVYFFFHKEEEPIQGFRVLAPNGRVLGTKTFDYAQASYKPCIIEKTGPGSYAFRGAMNAWMPEAKGQADHMVARLSSDAGKAWSEGFVEEAFTHQELVEPEKCWIMVTVRWGMKFVTAKLPWGGPWQRATIYPDGKVVTEETLDAPLVTGRFSAIPFK